jgi:hypothetical protein
MARTNTNAGSWVTEAVTPYKLAGILSKAMTEALDAPFEIAPQQLYGAVRSGSLEADRFDSGHMKVTPEKANAFIQARIDRQLSKNSEGESESTEAVAEEAAVS